jgi:Fe-S cluster biogenesis protein NfuA
MSRPVMPGASDAFSSSEDAGGHPLFTALLGIPHVDSVGVEHDLLVLAKSDRDVEWAPLMNAAREAIAAWFAAGLAPEVAVVAEGDRVAESALRVRIERVIADVVNPGVAAHGGEVELVEVRGSRIFVKLGGGCQGCGASAITVRHGLTTAVRRVAPEVTDIVDVTDHAAGENPYYDAEEAAGASALPTSEA